VRLASAIRPATDREFPLAVDVLRRAGFGTQVARLLEFPRRSPDGAILVAEGAGDSVMGVACCAAFANTGWIGALGVAPEARRRGLGAALTEAAVRWLRGRGSRTVLLYATEAGRPVYERLGFITEERAVAWRGVAGAAPPIDLQRLGDGDRQRLKALDQAVTGERRDNVLDAIHPLAGVAVSGGPHGLAGWAIASPWGAGTAIAALAPEMGVALMAAATCGPAAGTLIVPDINHAASDALCAWRFVRLNDALRMRLGPAVAWHPEQQFGLFNLFWG
jgi:GNAT superfamily N-acetyltransferase